jgi:hypothetical protein
MTKLLYPNGNHVAHATKEAVASSIVHTIYDRLRGAGPTGRIIYREKPSKVIHTQHLLPRRKPSPTAATYAEKDDVTSPAHIGTAGLTFQIADQDRAEQLGSYNAATAVIAARRRLVNAAAIAGSALSKGISAKQRSWKRTSC